MSNYDFFIKLVIIGNANVGKTKIIERYVNNIYYPNSTSTMGIDFYSKKLFIKDNNVKLQLWDTAGQEKFMAITSSFIKKTNGIILVYDITNPSSYTNLNKWLNVIKKNATETEYDILLLGNKYDMCEKREVEFFDGSQFAITNNISMFEEVSALENSDNIKKIIDDFIYIIVERMIENAKKESSNQKKSLKLTELSNPNVLKSHISNKKKSNCC